LKSSHTVTILGRELSVISSASPEKVRGVELFVNERLEDIAGKLKKTDIQLTLILALLNVAEELLELKNSEKKEQDIEKRVAVLIDRIGSA